jgi:hypothetical protein
MPMRVEPRPRRRHGTIRSVVPARIDRLTWSPFHPE